MIQLKNISKSYKNKEIFNRVSLEIPQNAFVTLHGDSGSGKSTLLNVIGLIEPFNDGQYHLFDQPAPEPNSKKALLLRRNKIAYLFQNYGLIEEETIKQNLELVLVYEKLSASKKNQKMMEALQAVNLEMRLNKKIYELSGGEKQRVALARIILKKSELILADEPTGSLDKNNGLDVINLLKAQQEKGKTICIVTHDPAIIKKSDYSISIDSLLK